MENIEFYTNAAYDTLIKTLSKNHLITPWAPEDKPIVLRGFQQTIVDSIAKDTNQLIGVEVYCAGGKTILSAELAVPYVLAGKRVIFISPKRDAFQHFVHEFDRVYFQHTGKSILPIIHARHTTQDSLFPPDKQVYICTPYDIVKGASVTVQGALKQSGLIFVDEVHRIPHDPENETQIIGKVEPIVRKYAMKNSCKIVCLTGTYGRADGKAPFGKHTPDYKVTAQQLIEEGSLPPLFGFQIPINVEVGDGEFKRGTDTIHLKFARKKLVQYLNKVADPMMKIIELEEKAKIARSALKPSGHAIFVSRKIEAEEICQILNKRLGWNGFVTYTADTLSEERLEIQEKLRKGELLGFATVMLGVESINIPRLKYCHCVARITSENKLMQALGRVMRLPNESDADCCLIKREAVFVDYQVLRTKIIRLCKGIRDIARLGGSKKRITKDGNIFITRDGFDISSIEIGDYDAWIRKESGVEDRDAEMKKLALIAMAKAGLPRPSYKRGSL